MMKRSESLDRAIKKYESEKIDKVLLRMPKGKREIVQQHADAHRESVNGFINRAIDETMQRDNESISK